MIEELIAIDEDSYYEYFIYGNWISQYSVGNAPIKKYYKMKALVNIDRIEDNIAL